MRRPVRAESIYYVGKESNYLDDVDCGLEHNLEEVQNKYVDPREPQEFDRYVRPILKYIPLRVLAMETGNSERFLRAVRKGHKRTSEKVEAKLTHLAAEHVRHISNVIEDNDLRACRLFGADERR